jgi:hypothetical protein
LDGRPTRTGDQVEHHPGQPELSTALAEEAPTSGETSVNLPRVWGTNQTSRRVLAATITAGALLLSGCTTGEPGDDITAPSFAPVSPQPSEPEAAPSPDEPSAEPTLAAPPLPPEAAEQTPEGAVAFTEWWFDTLNYATETGNTDALRAASDPECTTCNNYLGEIEDAYRSGGRIDGGHFQVTASTPGAVEALGIRLLARGDVAATRILDQEGDVTTEYVAAPVANNVTLLRADSGWVMASLGNVE